MKRLISFLIAASFLLSACGANASLWGQYATPTSLGGVPKTLAPIPATVTVIPQPFATEAVTNTLTPTPTFSGAFVTEEAASPTVKAPAPTATSPTVLYYSQNGDWLPAVAIRFGVEVSEITSPKALSAKGLLDTGTLLMIPDRLDRSVSFTPAVQLIPDNELIFSATSLDFDIEAYIKEAGGYLATHREYLGATEWTTGAREIERLAKENSINPRLLLAILDYEAHWVRGKPENEFRTEYPLGYENYRYKGMFMQMVWAVNQLSHGYYNWRAGTLTELTFQDGSKLRIDPTLNAGTVGLMYYFARAHSLNEWLRIMDQSGGFLSFYQDMFSDPWARADSVGPIFPPGAAQPGLSLPFTANSAWAFTSGPHGAWEQDGPMAALDFAPPSAATGCLSSDKWIVASAPGLVVRSERGVVVVDMDGDGKEQTGWTILYLHVAASGRVAEGEWVERDTHIGHPSCEGGISTGTHLHVARKYNGEWVAADGPIPFVLSGWTVQAGEKPYQGKLVKGDKVITADVYGQSLALIVREDDPE